MPTLGCRPLQSRMANRHESPRLHCEGLHWSRTRKLKTADSRAGLSVRFALPQLDLTLVNARRLESPLEKRNKSEAEELVLDCDEEIPLVDPNHRRSDRQFVRSVTGH